MGRIGDTGPLFFVGKGKSWTASASGRRVAPRDRVRGLSGGLALGGRRPVGTLRPGPAAANVRRLRLAEGVSGSHDRRFLDNITNRTIELYNGSTDTLEVIKWKEFYDMIEEAIDACEDVGNTLERIVLKNG